MSQATNRVVAIIWLCAALSAFASAGVNVPDWVREAAVKPQGSYPKETAAVVLLDDLSAILTKADEMEISYRRVVRILRPEGHEQTKLQVEIRMGDKLQSMRAWTMDSAGRQYELKDKDFQEDNHSEELYTDLRTRYAKPPAADPGSVIAFEYAAKRHLWREQYGWAFQEELPVEEARFTLQLPAGWEYSAGWLNVSPDKPNALGPGRWQWVRRNVVGLGEEPLRPADRALAGMLVIAFFPPGGGSNLGTWASIGDWYYHLTEGRRTSTPEISAKVKQLTAGAAGFDARVSALGSFVQSDVRYVEIAIGIGGVQPHQAADVFRYRYGDCKDKVTLLSAMLKDAGINSEYVLVNTEPGAVKPDVPSTFFDHAIVAIELPPDAASADYHSVVTTKLGTRYVLFDPTDPYTALGDLYSALQGSYGLLVTKAGGELIQLPVLSPDSNRLERQGKFILQADGSISGTVVEKRTGDHALLQRQRLAHENEDERQKYMEKYVGEFLRNPSVQQAKVGGLALGKDLTMEYQVSAKNYAQHTGPLLLIRVRVLGEKSFSLDLAKRKYPVEFPYRTVEKDTFELELPAGFVVDELPEPQQLDVGFATYSSKVELTGSTLRYSREYVLRESYIGLDRLSDLRKLQNAIRDDESASAVLKKTT